MVLPLRLICLPTFSPIAFLSLLFARPIAIPLLLLYRVKTIPYPMFFRSYIPFILFPLFCLIPFPLLLFVHAIFFLLHIFPSSGALRFPRA
jgi:hypothetical protein